jgi:predicted metal-dependent HD superfamily phosphohydrolase
MEKAKHRPGPDLEGLARHVRGVLDGSLGAHVHYHDATHTFRDVVPAAKRLALAEGAAVQEHDRIVAAAILHDVGFVDGPEDHERTSAAMARRLLPDFGFDGGAIEEIEGMILATRIGTDPVTRPESILKDADLDVLGREDFWVKNVLLRREMEAFGARYDDAAWWRGQRRFLATHRYATHSARRSRGPGKLENLRRIEAHLDRLAGER